MKNAIMTVYISTFLLFLSCFSIKKSTTLLGPNLHEQAIDMAIRDFSTKCKLFKKDSVFSVNLEDSVFYKVSLVQDNQGTYNDGRTHQWEREDLLDGIMSVGIASSYYQYYYSEETKRKLPTRYVIKDGKLFYWWDENSAVTEEIIAVLWRYNVLQNDCIIPEFSSNDSQKGAHYYFCKNDLSKYKRVLTNIGLGFYKPPQLKCE